MGKRVLTLPNSKYSNLEYNSNNISNSRKFKKIHRCTSLAYLMLKPYVLMYFCLKIITKKLKFKVYE